MTKNAPVANLLPRYVAEALQRAANTPIPENDPLARIKAIDKTTEWAKFNFPFYFIKENNHEN